MTRSDVDWPAGFERTPPAERRTYPHGFQTSMMHAFQNIVDELEKMDAEQIRVESGHDHRTDKPHLPYKRSEADDPGVVAYFNLDGEAYAVPCDRWDNTRDNAQAIARYLDAKRAIERYQVATIDSEFAASALPSGEEDSDDPLAGYDPYDVLGVSETAPESVIKAAARARKGEAHPDSGGDREEFDRVKAAEERLLG